MRFMSASLRRCLGVLPWLLVGCSIETGNLFGGSGEGAGPSTGGSNPQGGTIDPGGGPQGGAGGVADGGGPAQGGGGGVGPGPGGGGAGQGGNPTGMGVCGDNVQDAGEQCDGSDLGGADCNDFGFVGPNGLLCGDGCVLDPSNCKPECGNMVIEPTEQCDDGNMQPNDGCSPTCNNQGGNCNQPIAVSAPLGLTVISGTTAGMSNEQPGNSFGCQGADGPELVYQVTPAVSGFLTAYIPSASADFDSVLYARSSCAAPERLCHDNFNTPGNDGGEVISFPAEAGVPVLLFVDGYQAADDGAFQLEIDLSSGLDCADPVPITIEGDASIRAIGNTTGTGNEAASNIICTNAGGGPEVVYQVLTLEDYQLDFDLVPGMGHNTVVHARTACENQDSQVACNSNPTSTSSSIQFAQDTNETTFVFADGTGGQQGPYTLTVSH